MAAAAERSAGLIVRRARIRYECGSVAITVDPTNRDRTLAGRGLAFEHAEFVFAGPGFRVEDIRRDDGERRIVTVGLLTGRMVIWTPRARNRHVFSMRRADVGERERVAPLIR
jgi:uncharacterized DUF497 family protein